MSVRVKPLNVLVAAALAVSTTVVFTPSAASADGDDARAALDAAIAASSIAYSNGVSSVLTVDEASPDGSFTKRSQEAAGVTGAGIYGPAPQVELLWMTRDGEVPYAGAATPSGEVLKVYEPLPWALAGHGFPVPKRVKAVVRADVAGRGGDARSLVPVDRTDARDPWFRFDTVLESANPAALVAELLEQAASPAVTAGPGGNEPAFSFVWQPRNDPEGDRELFDVFVNQTGVIDRVAVTWPGSGETRATGLIEVVAVGDAVVVPDAVLDRVDTPLVVHAIEYSLYSDMMRSDIGAAAMVARALAALEGTKVTRAMIKQGLKEAYVDGTGVDGFSNTYAVRQLRNGYRVVVVDAPGQKRFGKLCRTITAKGDRVAVRSCSR